MALRGNWLGNMLPLVVYSLICAYFVVRLLLYCFRGRPRYGDDEEERTADAAETMGGLQRAEILSLPNMVYSAGGGEAGECAVCLGEFEEKEVLKELPECKHQFHEQCIGTWLQHNPTCPLCRGVVMPQPAVVIDVR